VEQKIQPQRTWNCPALLCASLVAFAYHSFWLFAKYRGYQHTGFWYEAQAWAGVAFVGIVLLRVFVAGVSGERNAGWKVYLALVLLSPVWIRAVFELVLKIRDAYGN
jgi:hypothetical protein